MVQGWQGTGTGTTTDPLLGPQILLVTRVLARGWVSGQELWGSSHCLHPGKAEPWRTVAATDFLPAREVGKPWQSRPLVAGFTLPVPDSMCNGI